VNEADRKVFETPWFSVFARPLAEGQPYYLLKLPDYVSVIATTASGLMIFVRQFRPVVDRYTIELPSGHVENGETPEQAAKRELLEETGYVADRVELLGTLVPDVGRLTNRMWCYFADDVTPSRAPVIREDGVSSFEIPIAEAMAYASDGRMDHALNLAPLFLALAHHKLRLT
jgi:ADP-ribose pyrophosphatase